MDLVAMLVFLHYSASDWWHLCSWFLGFASAEIYSRYDVEGSDPAIKNAKFFDSQKYLLAQLYNKIWQFTNKLALNLTSYGLPGATESRNVYTSKIHYSMPLKSQVLESFVIKSANILMNSKLLADFSICYDSDVCVDHPLEPIHHLVKLSPFPNILWN